MLYHLGHPAVYRCTTSLAQKTVASSSLYATLKGRVDKNHPLTRFEATFYLTLLVLQNTFRQIHLDVQYIFALNADVNLIRSSIL